MLRLTIFIISLLLLGGAIEPSKSWYITLSVLSGLSLIFAWPFMFGWYKRRWWWSERFARRMERRFERDWAWETDW